MEFVRDIVPLTPNTWDKEFVYNNKRYILVDLEKSSQEYNDVVEHFLQNCVSGSVHTIQRVQHIFAFARYQLHKEALDKNGYTFTEKIIYKPIREYHIPIYLEYNCDGRRLGSPLDLFSMSLHHALNQPGSSNYYVRQKFIQDHHFGKRDSNTCPEYVIKLRN